MKKRYIVLLIAVVIIAGVFIAYQSIKTNLDTLTTLPVSDIDLSQIDDGTYLGNYSAIPVLVEVSVTIENHVITKINLIKHQNGQGAPAEVIPSQVVQAQSLQIDTVSGATYSSKVILKAIEDALINANK